MQTHRFSCREEAWWTARIEVVKSWEKQRINLNSCLQARHSSILSKWFETVRKNRMVYIDKNDRRRTKLTLINRNQTNNFPGDTRKVSRLSSAMKESWFFPLKKRKQKEGIKSLFCKRMVKRHRVTTAQNLEKTKFKDNTYDELKKCSGYGSEWLSRQNNRRNLVLVCAKKAEKLKSTL